MIDEIVKYIGDNTSLVAGTNLFPGHFVDANPDRCSIAQEIDPSALDGFLADRVDKAITIQSRALTYFNARDDATEIYDLLHTKWGVTLDGVTSGVEFWCEIIEAQTAPQFAGQDEKARFYFSFTVVFKIQDLT